jgi:membrane protease YdiL (CAAX protease family)
VWPVFVAYAIAFVAIVVCSTLAVAVVRSLDPEAPEAEALAGLPGLLAGGIASSVGLMVTLAIVARGLSPARLRLVPGRESGRDLLVMIVGVLALGQALDSLTMLAGLGDQGTMETIRRALARASGPELFAAVVVIGVLAGTAEEVFFRGYMQALLREGWGPRLAVVVTSAAFGLLHLDWIHAPLAFALGLYLGHLTERTGSALPAVACHVVNNAVFTVLTAAFGALTAPGPNAVLLATTGPIFVACLVWLRRSLPGAPAPPPGPPA